MTRIIVEQHENGDEKLTAGYDRPMGYFFVDLYDDEMEKVGGAGLLGDRPCETANAAARFLVEHGVSLEKALEVEHLLDSHTTLEYPESNMVVNLAT